MLQSRNDKHADNHGVVGVLVRAIWSGPILVMALAVLLPWSLGFAATCSRQKPSASDVRPQSAPAIGTHPDACKLAELAAMTELVVKANPTITTEPAAPAKSAATANPAVPADSIVPVGPADSSGFVLLFTGNWGGKLEPCGCADKQLGGIDRRSVILNAIPGPQRLLLDVGPLIERDNRQSQLKLETFLYSLRHLGYDAINLTAAEIRLCRDTIGLASSERPPVLLTNTKDENQEQFGTISYLIKTLKVKKHQLRCLVLGLADPEPEATVGPERQIGILDPVTSLKKVLACQAAESDLVIVLLSSDNQGVVDALSKVDGIDIIVKVGYTDDPEMASPYRQGPVVITTGKFGKYVARLDLAVESSGRPADGTFRAIAIEEHFPKAPVIRGFFDDYQEMMKLENLVADEDALIRHPLPVGNRFMGNSLCGVSGCHKDIYKKWSSLSHSVAIETLQRPEINRLYDPECISCHTVGLEYVGGYRSLETTPQLADVGCEMCHGPGYHHTQDVFAPYREIFTECEDCHEHETSPLFDANREEYFEKVRHWTEPRKYWD